MVMATQKQEEPAIRVDRSRKYPTSAGTCDKCGYSKTWAFKILNPKTGKQVPGHVTKEGFKINDGDCPFYALLKQKADSKTDAPAQELAPADARRPAAAQQATAAADQRFFLKVALEEGEIVASVGPCATKLTKADAAGLAKALVDMIAS